MTEKRYFVVKSGRVSYAIEHGQHKRKPTPKESGYEILFECELPDGVELKAAIQLYESGMLTKPKGGSNG